MAEQKAEKAGSKKKGKGKGEVKKGPGKGGKQHFDFSICPSPLRKQADDSRQNRRKLASEVRKSEREARMNSGGTSGHLLTDK